MQPSETELLEGEERGTRRWPRWMVVLAVVVLGVWLPLAIAVLLLPAMVVPIALTPLLRTKCPRSKADIVSISSAVDQFAIENDGKWPASLRDLVTPDENGFTYFGEDYVPHDPWGREYGYEPPPAGTRDYRVFTLGQDGRPGGSGSDRDIDNLMIRNGEI